MTREQAMLRELDAFKDELRGLVQEAAKPAELDATLQRLVTQIARVIHAACSHPQSVVL